MTMNVTGYMKDIDAEISHYRDMIDQLTLKIAKLEDMRVLMMKREEYRSAVNGRPSPFGALQGIEIAVRDMDQGVLSHAAKTGALPAPGTNSSGNMRGMNGKADGMTPEQRAERKKQLKLEGNRRYREKKAKERGPTRPRHANGQGLHKLHWASIERLLRTNPKSQFNVVAILDRLGMSDLKGRQRQPVYQALYEMRKFGILERPSSGVYQIAQKAVAIAAE